MLLIIKINLNLPKILRAQQMDIGFIDHVGFLTGIINMPKGRSQHQSMI